MAFIPTIGQMRMVLQFNQPDKNPDGSGGNLENYSEWFVTRGFLQMENMLRDFDTGYDQSIKTYDCWVPWRNEFEANVTKDTRIMYEARSFRVHAFSLVGEQRRLYHLKLKEVR